MFSLSFCQFAVANLAQTPIKTNNIVTYISDTLHDYRIESGGIGGIRLISKEPLHFLLSPAVFDGEVDEQIRRLVKRSILYGIYRTFIHTDSQSVTVTVIPLLQSGGYLEQYTETVSITRGEALSIAKLYMGVNSFSELIGNNVGNEYDPVSWSDAFENVYYSEDLDYFKSNSFFIEYSGSRN